MANLQKIDNLYYIPNYEQTWSQFVHKRIAGGRDLPAVNDLDWTVHSMPVSDNFKDPNFCYSPLGQRYTACGCLLVALRWQWM